MQAQITSFLLYNYARIHLPLPLTTLYTIKELMCIVLTLCGEVASSSPSMYSMMLRSPYLSFVYTKDEVLCKLTRQRSHCNIPKPVLYSPKSASDNLFT